MTNPNVNKVEHDKTMAALIALDEVDVDAANLLRTLMRAYCVFDIDLFEMVEMLLRLERGMKGVTSEVHELAMGLERIARDAER